jgi:large subunit ribosomal protein L29
MKYIDLKEKSAQDLAAMLKEKKVLLFSLKNKLRLMQLSNTSEIKAVRKDIARIKTAMNAQKDN